MSAANCTWVVVPVLAPGMQQNSCVQAAHLVSSDAMRTGSKPIPVRLQFNGKLGQMYEMAWKEPVPAIAMNTKATAQDMGINTIAAMPSQIMPGCTQASGHRSLTSVAPKMLPLQIRVGYEAEDAMEDEEMPLTPLAVQTSAFDDDSLLIDTDTKSIACPSLNLALSMPEQPRNVSVDRLFDAITHNDFAGVRALLCTGVDPNVFTAKGSHVLFRAAFKAKEPAIVKLLLAAGANARACHESGSQVLHFWARGAASHQDHSLEIGRALLLAGADPNAARHDDGMTPLHHVVVRFNSRRGWHDFHRALLLVRAGANITAKTKMNQTPSNMIQPSNRIAVGRLTELLTIGVRAGSKPGSWPVCPVKGCKWCA